MRVAILGAAGQTGRQLIAAALSRGHEVIAIARSPDKIVLDNAADESRVTRRPGDGFDENSIVAALAGADAVITTVGKTDLRDKRYNLSTAAHRSVMAGMRVHGIGRLLAISSIGAAQGIKRKGLRRNIYLYLRRKYYRDMFEMEQEIAASGLDYTVVRAPMLYDGPAANNYTVIATEEYFDALRLSRADLAHFLLEDLASGTWIRRVIAVADKPAC